MITVYGIKTCQTCRKALAWLDERGVAYEWVDLREDPPDRDQIEQWVAAFGVKPLRNTSGGSYRALGADKHDWTDDEWLDAFDRDPMLLKRPVVERDGVPVMVGFRGTDEDKAAKLL